MDTIQFFTDEEMNKLREAQQLLNEMANQVEKIKSGFKEITAGAQMMIAAMEKFADDK